MKKIILLIGVIFLISSFNNIVFANEKMVKITEYTGKYDYEKNEFILNFEIYNNSEYDTSGTAITAIFNNDDKLICEQKVETGIFANSDIHKKMTFNISKEIFECGYVKILFWKDINSMQPLADEIYTKISDMPTTKENTYFNFYEQKFIDVGTVSEQTTVDGLTFIGKSDGKPLSVTSSGYLYFFGGGNNNDCSVKFDVQGKCRLNFYAKPVSGTDSRYLKINNGTSNIAELEILPEKITLASYNYNGDSGSLYIASKSSGLYVCQIEVLYDYDDDDYIFGDKNIEISAKTYSEISSGIIKATALGGGTVFIDTNKVDCNGNFLLSSKNANVTISGGDGYTPIIDFENYRNSFPVEKRIGEKGFLITGSNYTIKNVIIQNAPGTGVTINKTGSSNLIENVIARYNDGAGLAMYQGATDNTFKNCYSYRNCDIVTMGDNADGFGIAINGGKGNKFVDCYSWENSDDGFDSFAMYEDVSYENCMAWNNGNPDVFSGKYDFDNGRKLDENLRLVKMIMEKDPTFKENYNNGIFNLPTDEFITCTKKNETENSIVSVQGFCGDFWRGNPNGFKLGSGDSTHGPQVGANASRYMKNCIAFNHIRYGFDKNGSACSVYINNGLSFGNKIDYLLDTCTIKQFDNVFGYNGKNRMPIDISYNINNLSASKFAIVKAMIDKEVARIEDLVYNNQIPDKLDFDNIFLYLTN